MTVSCLIHKVDVFLRESLAESSGHVGRENNPRFTGAVSAKRDDTLCHRRVEDPALLLNIEGRISEGCLNVHNAVPVSVRAGVRSHASHGG